MGKIPGINSHKKAIYNIVNDRFVQLKESAPPLQLQFPDGNIKYKLSTNSKKNWKKKYKRGFFKKIDY